MMLKIFKNDFIQAVILGVLFALAFAPFFFTASIAISLALLFRQLLNSNNNKKSFLIGLSFGFGFFLTSCYWIGISFTINAEKFASLIPIAIPALCIVLAIFIAFTGMLFQILRSNNIYLNILNFTICWCLLEYIRVYLFSGMPWNLAGYSLSNNLQIAQFASLFGIYGLSIITILFGSSCYLFLYYKTKKAKLLLSVILLIPITIIYIYGDYKLQNNPTIFTNIKIQIVQANMRPPSIPTHENLMSILNQNLFTTNKISEHADIIIWPEGVLPYPIDGNSSDLSTYLSEYLPKNSYLIAGGTRYDGKNYYNSLFLFDHNQNPIKYYDKIHLVPFGEYFPFRKILDFDSITNGSIDYGFGDVKGGIEIDDLKTNFLPIICYESIFPELSSIKYRNHADSQWLLNISNDGWFGDSTGPYQHFYMARIRAIEQGLPLIRAANTGISAIFDGYGRIIQKTNLLENTNIINYLPIKASHTLFSNINHLYFLILYITILLILIIHKILRKKNA
jgi:apolipoprotein N-acyltransferase